MHRRPFHLFFSLSIIAFVLGTVAGDEPDGAWLSEVERRIARAEYEITWQTATVLDDLAASGTPRIGPRAFARTLRKRVSGSSRGRRKDRRGSGA